MVPAGAVMASLNPGSTGPPWRALPSSALVNEGATVCGYSPFLAALSWLSTVVERLGSVVLTTEAMADCQSETV
jgi:hypothetical protein